MSKEQTRKPRSNTKQKPADKKPRFVNLAEMSDEAIEKAIWAVVDSIERLYCTCAAPHHPPLPLDTYVRNKKAIAAKQKNDGSRHSPRCPKHDINLPSSPERGWTSTVLRKGKDGTYHLRPAFSTMALTGEVDYTVSVPHARETTVGPRSHVRLPSASLMGTLSLLTQIALLDRFVPGRLVSDFQFFWELNEAAKSLDLRGFPRSPCKLSDRMLLPRGENDNWVRNNHARLAFAGRYRVLVVMPLKSSMLERPGGVIRLDHVFGVPASISSMVLDRACDGSRAAHKAVAEGRKAVLFGIATVVKGDHGELEARVDDACLLSVTENWVPNFSSYEHMVFTFLERHGILYFVELVYDRERFWGLRPDAYLSRWGIVIEIFGMNTPEYREWMAEKIKKYNRNCPGRFWYWDVLNESFEDAMKRLLDLIEKLEAEAAELEALQHGAAVAA